MAKFGWRDGKLWAKDVKVEGAPEFTVTEGDNDDLVIYVNGEKKYIELSDTPSI